MCSKKANVIDPGTKILTVSSKRPTAKTSYPEPEDVDQIFFGEDFEDSFSAAQYIDDAHSHSIAYMASVLEAKIIGGKRRLIKCEDCVGTFIENELLEDSFIRFKARRSNIMQPCKSTFEICKFVDKFIKSCEEWSSTYQAVAVRILREVQFDTLYSSSNFENHTPSDYNHKYDFVKKIIELYMNMKSVHIAKCFTLKTRDNPIRHIYRKLVHEYGQ